MKVDKIHFIQTTQTINKLSSHSFAFAVVAIFVINPLSSTTNGMNFVSMKIAQSADCVRNNYQVWKIWIITWRTVTIAFPVQNAPNRLTRWPSWTNINGTMKSSYVTFVHKLVIQRTACASIWWVMSLVIEILTVQPFMCCYNIYDFGRFISVPVLWPAICDPKACWYP